MMTAKEILKKIEEIRMNGACFGIRCTDETHEIGDELENSYNWNEFDEEHDGEELDGTCCTGFGYLWFDGEQGDLDEIQKALDINSRYSGKHQYLVYARYGGEYGDDEQEVIFPAPEVVAVIR